MKQDDLHWLADELALPVLEETPRGLVANAAARDALGGREVSASIASAAAELLGIDEDGPALREAIAEARSGRRHASCIEARGRLYHLLATPLTPSGSRIALTIAPKGAKESPRERLVDVAAAVSHEVANAVGAIRGWADLALRHGAAHDDVRDALRLIAGAARSAEHAARGMLTLARAGAAEEAEPHLDLSDFTSELLRLLTLSAREAGVTLDASIDARLFVRASRAQLFTILFNLVKNAIEASDPGGRVEVRAEGDEQQVQVEVRDSGRGIDTGTQARLFEPYFTTKARGTGLGLSLVRDAVAAIGAALDVESEAGHGASFRVRLPRAAAPAAEASRVDLRPVPEPGTEPLEARVLIVDDDLALREMLATALSLRGADVTSVASYDDAIALEGHFDIALIDMQLGIRRGDELLALLRQRGIVSAAMLVTGAVQKPRLVHGGEPDDWVRKPFEIPHLIERLRRTLAQKQRLSLVSGTAGA